MRRSSRESMAGARPSSLLLQNRRAGSNTAGSEGIDLISRSRRRPSLLVASAATEGSDAHKEAGTSQIESLPIESSRMPDNGTNNLLSDVNTDAEKHDYDWLLTPPGTPRYSTSEARDSQLPVEKKNNLSARSVPSSKSSRLSVHQSEKGRPTRPVSSSYVVHTSITSPPSSNVSNDVNGTSVQYTSMASVTSCKPSTPDRLSTPARPSTPHRLSTPARPSTPNRLSTPAKSSVPTKPTTPGRPSTSCRPSTPSRRISVSTTNRTAVPPSHPVTSHPSTPVKPHPPASGNKTHPAHVSRPSTPSRPHISAISNSSSISSVTVVHSQVPAGSNSTSNPKSRATTPTHRMPVSSSAPVASRSTSAGRFPASISRNSGSLSRPNSPGPWHRASVQPIIPPGFPLDAPPNLLTKLPERPASAGRTRPGAKLTGRANLNSEPSPPTNPTRRQSSSPVSRGCLHNNSPKARVPSNGYGASPTEKQKTATDGMTKRSSKTATATESNGLGRTLTKKSLDIALKNMDIRPGAGGIRRMSLFPHSIRMATSKSSSVQSSVLLTPTSSNETDTEDNSCNRTTSSGSASVKDSISENGDILTSFPHGAILVSRVAEPDLYKSYVYDAILMRDDTEDMDWLHNGKDNTDLLKEDTKDIEWLHSADNDPGQSSIFENQFEPLPEPFGLK